MRFKEAIITELVAELNKTKAAQVKTDFCYPALIPLPKKKTTLFLSESIVIARTTTQERN